MNLLKYLSQYEYHTVPREFILGLQQQIFWFYISDPRANHQSTDQKNISKGNSCVVKGHKDS